MSELSSTESSRSEIEAVRRRMDRNSHGHISQALRLKLADDVATFTTTIGGAAVVAMSASLLGSHGNRDLIEVALAVVSGFITLVAVWQAVWQPGERSRRHKDWSAKFAAIENECRLVECGLSNKSVADLLSDALRASEQADLVAERFWRKRRQQINS